MREAGPPCFTLTKPQGVFGELQGVDGPARLDERLRAVSSGSRGATMGDAPQPVSRGFALLEPSLQPLVEGVLGSNHEAKARICFE